MNLLLDNSTILKVDNLVLNLDNKNILKNVNFFVKKGEICGFVGENGAGKTSTIKCIVSELSDWMGDIVYQGHNLNRSDLKHISFFPDTNNVPLQLSVYDYARYRYLLSRKDYSLFLPFYDNLASSLRLTDFKKTKLDKLSGGEKKRAILLASLITGPDLLIMDEPTANLDIATKLEFIDFLKLIQQIGITTIITSHEFGELQNIINRLIIIDSGQITYNEHFDGKKEKITDIYQQLRVCKDFASIKNNKALMDLLKEQMDREGDHE